MKREEGVVGGDGKTSPFGNGLGAPQYQAVEKPANPMDDSSMTSGGQGSEQKGSGYDPASVPPGGAILYADPTTPKTKPDGGVNPASLPYKIGK